VGSGGYTGYGIDSNGKLWVWGRSQVGQAGLGNTTEVSSPTQVGTLTDWKYIVAGVYHSFFVKTDNTLWACGMNKGDGAGSISDGTSGTNRSSPVQIGSLTTWTDGIGCYGLSFALADGKLWTGGRNSAGWCGNGNTTNQSSPIQIGALTTWRTIGQATNGCAPCSFSKGNFGFVDP